MVKRTQEKVDGTWLYLTLYTQYAKREGERSGLFCYMENLSVVPRPPAFICIHNNARQCKNHKTKKKKLRAFDKYDDDMIEKGEGPSHKRIH